MIDALFNDPNYLAGKKTLDAIALREQAIALHEPLNRFLRQGMREGFRAAQCWSLLEQTISLPAHPAPTQPGPAK